MLTILVERGGLAFHAVWDQGELAGEEPIPDLIDAMAAAGVEVLVTPVGPSLPVSVQEPRTIVRALEDEGATVTVEGDWPDPTWEDPAEDVDF